MCKYIIHAWDTDAELLFETVSAPAYFGIIFFLHEFALSVVLSVSRQSRDFRVMSVIFGNVRKNPDYSVHGVNVS